MQTKLISLSASGRIPYYIAVRPATNAIPIRDLLNVFICFTSFTATMHSRTMISVVRNADRAPSFCSFCRYIYIYILLVCLHTPETLKVVYVRIITLRHSHNEQKHSHHRLYFTRHLMLVCCFLTRKQIGSGTSTIACSIPLRTKRLWMCFAIVLLSLRFHFRWEKTDLKISTAELWLVE